jgi:hypothetical protein
VIRNPDLDGGVVALLAPGVRAGAGNAGASSPRVMNLTLGAVLVLSLVVVAGALASRWLLPRPLVLRAYGHHDDFVVGVIAVALSVGLALAIVFLLS